MNYSDACVDLVKKSEGLLMRAYPDPASGGAPWTIGYGHTGHDVYKGLVWTMAMAEKALTADLDTAAAVVNSCIGQVKTTQGQFDAMTDFVFNLGGGQLRTSTLLQRHLAGKYEEASEEFPKWIYASGKKMPGLVTRRNLEKEMYNS